MIDQVETKMTEPANLERPIEQNAADIEFSLCHEMPP